MILASGAALRGSRLARWAPCSWPMAARVGRRTWRPLGGGLLSVQPFWALVRKEVQQILRDPAADQGLPDHSAHSCSC